MIFNIPITIDDPEEIDWAYFWEKKLEAKEDRKKELKTEQAKKIFEILMDAGADMETVLNVLRLNIPEEYQQDLLLKAIKDEELVYANEIILKAVEIDETEHPGKFC